MSDSNKWDVSYSTICFFEKALRCHNQVESFKRTDDIFFTIKRTSNLSEVKALLVNVYTIGLADIFRAKTEFPLMDCLVTSGKWNAYTPEAKKHGLENHIGIFIVDEFFAALWRKEPCRYIKRDDEGKPIYHYRSP